MNNKLLLVVDVQNDFCAKNGKFDELNEPIDVIKKSMPKVRLAIKNARESGQHIVYTRSLQVYKKLPKNIQERMKRYGRQENYLIPGSWGADFFQVLPSKKEVIIDKYRYDIFTNPEFEEYLTKNKINEIVFCGFFIDVCIDTAMRTAYQKGYYVTLLKDATSALYYDKKTIENFMAKFYNARIESVNKFFS